MTHYYSFEKSRVNFHKPIVNGPRAGIWNEWNWLLCVTLHDEIHMVGSFQFHQVSRSGFAHSRTAHEIINKQAVSVCVCVQSSASWRARCNVLRRRFVSLYGAEPCVFLHIRQFSPHTHAPKFDCVCVCVCAHIAFQQQQGHCFVVGFRDETQTTVACVRCSLARSHVCVLWNVKSNLPIARLRAENETTTCSMRMRAKETEVRVGNMHNSTTTIAIVRRWSNVCVCAHFTRNCVCFLCGTVRRGALRQCDSSISIQFENGRQC